MGLMWLVGSGTRGGYRADGAGAGRLKAIAFRAVDNALAPALMNHNGGAFHFAAAFKEAARLAEPIDRADCLEFSFVSSAGRVIEGNREIH